MSETNRKPQIYAIDFDGTIAQNKARGEVNQ